MNRIVLALLLGATVVHAADQTILGNQLLVKNPSTPEKRQVSATAKEKASPDTLVGDPTVNGATLTVRAEGANPTEQTFSLPQGTNAKGKPFWTGSTATGFKYKDPAGENSPVKDAQIKKTGKGVFTMKFKADGKLGPVSVVPPDPGDGGCVLLALTGGDSYSVSFAPGDGQVTNKDSRLFKVTKPANQGTCVVPPTTTTSSTTTTTTSSTTTTTVAAFDGPAFPPVGGNVQFMFAGNSQNPGGADLSLFTFVPADWTALYWGPWAGSLPAAGLDGQLHTLSFAGISADTATWQGSTPWTDPSDNTVYDVPIQLTVTITAPPMTLAWAAATGVPGLDPGPGAGIGAVIDVAPGGTALDFTVKLEFTADIPTDMSGYVALSTIPQLGGGLTLTSFSGGFYSQP